MTQSCPPDVIAAIRQVIDVTQNSKCLSWQAVPYDIVAHLLRDDFGHSDEQAHILIFSSVMSGQVCLGMAKVSNIDSKEQLCLESEGTAWQPK